MTLNFVAQRVAYLISILRIHIAKLQLSSTKYEDRRGAQGGQTRANPEPLTAKKSQKLAPWATAAFGPAVP